MALHGLGTVGAKQSIPYRQVESEIGVELLDNDRVVHAMHIRRDDKKSQHSIDGFRNPNVSMIEHGSRIQHNLEYEHRQKGRPEKEYGADLDAHRDDYLNGMKPGPRRNVEVEVGMMHHMEPP